jgi:hypothetical protein
MDRSVAACSCFRFCRLEYKAAHPVNLQKSADSLSALDTIGFSSGLT